MVKIAVNSILTVASTFALADSKAVRIPLRHKHVPFVRTDRRLTALGDAESKLLPIRGSDQRFGEYSVDVVVGGQLFSLQVDTGSSDLAIGSVACSGCQVKINQPYNPYRDDSKAEPLGCDWCSSHAGSGTETSCKVVKNNPEKMCTFMIKYADDSGFSAMLYNDTVSFADGMFSMHELEVNVAVGAMYEARFPNPKMIDGIIGFAGIEASASGARSPFGQMVKEGKVNDIFSICLHPNGIDGQLYLGTDGLPKSSGKESNATTIHGRAILDTEWTPMLKQSGKYGVEMKDIRIGGESIGVQTKAYNDGPDGAIVDSGTQDVSLPTPAYSAIKSHLQNMCFKGACLKGICDCERKLPLTHSIFTDKCVPMAAVDRDAYPMIEIEFADKVVVKYPPSNYLKNGAAFCDGSVLDQWTIAISDIGPDGSGSILGESFMQGYLIVHDREKSRMGFQPVSEINCPGTTRPMSDLVIV